MRLMEMAREGFHSLFRSVYRCSEKLDLVPVWARLGRMDPFLPGPGYSLLIADQWFQRDNFRDASRLVLDNILTYLGRARPMPLFPPGKAGPQRRACGDGGRSTCLRDVYAVMDALNLKAFIAFGTLLGHVREKGFIRNDGDLDIGVEYTPSDPERMADALARYGFRVKLVDGPSWPCRIKCVHAEGARVDIIFFHRRDGKFRTYCEYKGRKIFRERACFGLKRAEFQSVQVWVPENPEAFLDENYLDWRVPQARSHSLFTSALTDYRDDAIRYFALRHLYALVRRKNRDHFEFFLELFHSRNPTDPFWPEILKTFKARHAS